MTEFTEQARADGPDVLEDDNDINGAMMGVLVLQSLTSALLPLCATAPRTLGKLPPATQVEVDAPAKLWPPLSRRGSSSQ